MRTIIGLLLRRVPALLLVLVGTSVVTFAIAHVIPTDPARLIAGEQASDEVLARVRNELGFDDPLWQQYLRYCARLLEGDLGTSLRNGQPVADGLASALPATIELAGASFFLIVTAGLLLGSLTAYYKDSVFDQVVRAVSAAAISAPTFWTGLLLIGVFFAWLDLMPAGGRIGEEFAQLPRVTGLYTVDALLDRNVPALLDALRHLALPALTLALASAGGAIRLVRASLLEVLREDHVRRARAAGLPEWTVMTRYALPAASIPFLTTLGLQLADLMAGAIVTEMIFSWPGLGSYAMEAISGLDFPAIMGFTLLVAVFYAVANALVDVSYHLLDPRTRSAT